jgi:hypothetical protein
MAHIDALSELEKFGDAGKPWCDLIFDIVEQKVVTRQYPEQEVKWVEGKALADLHGRTIGFGFSVPMGVWREGKTPLEEDDEAKVCWSQIEISSLGDETDRLLSFYSKWFELPLRHHKVPGQITCSAVAFEADNEDILFGDVRFKLFFEDDQAGRKDGEADPNYAELFFYMDLNNDLARLREKDPGHRAPLLRFLSGEAQHCPSVPLLAGSI